MEKIILIVPLIPVLSALLTQLFSARFGHESVRISITGSLLTFLFTVATLWFVLSEPGSHAVSLFDTAALLLLDPLSSLMATVIAGISLIVHIYSRRYMADESGYCRFFILLDLMTASLLVMVAAGDLLTLLIAWHLVGVLLYFLLGHNTRDKSAWRYAFWTKITYRLGDLPLVIAAVLLYQAYGTWSLPLLFEQVMAEPDAHQVFGLRLPDVVAALIAFSAFARSAQFLVHTWLPYTMSGPTPVSALMHAGIVNAGGFIINRFAPVFVQSADVLHWVFIVGLFTAVIGSVLMLTQNDIKKSLGYSTMGQMGFMIMECGIGAFSLAIYHLIAHGLFKGTMFLGAGSVINSARKNDGVPKEDLYTFIVERKPARQRLPWLTMAAVTLVVPVFILVSTHWLISQDYFQKQSAVVLLFFGWITGAQLIFSTYKMGTQNMRRMVILAIISFAVVVLGYTLISHAFDLFLYPDPVFREQLYAAADIHIIWFDALIVLITLIIIFGWFITFLSGRDGASKNRYASSLWLMFYALTSREFYLPHLYTLMTRRLLRLAERLNVWLRWI